MTQLNEAIATQIAAQLVERGFSTCSIDDVYAVQRYGSVDESTMSDEYDERLSEQIIEQLDAYGIEVA